MFVNDAHEAAINFLPRFVPTHFNVYAIALHQRLAQTIWVFVQLLQRAALWTNEAFTKYVIAIATNARHCSVFNGDFQTACCFTQWTCSVMGALIWRFRHGHIVPYI